MSQVDILAQTTASIMLFNAICSKYARDSLREDINLPEGSVGEVKLTFNGVEIPFEATVEDMWRQVNDDVDRRAEKKALELIKGAGLEKAREAMQRAEWHFENAVHEALTQLNMKGD